jgi:Zn-dependent peptidase ImmA (M78 family)
MIREVNPLMVTLAREARGRTQSDLAASLGISQGKLSKVESGQLRVSPDQLSGLVRELGFPEEFFFQTEQVYPAGMHLYRIHKTLPARDLNRIVAWMNIARLHVKLLLKAAEIDYLTLPECDLDEYESPEEIARAIRHYAKLPKGPIENMVKVVEDFGVVVVPLDISTHMFAGASMVADGPTYIIVINSQMSGDRFRWTLAHELGHLVMHQLPTANMEPEADAFARELLMPAREIKPFLENVTVAKLAALKRHWKIAMSALLMHAKELGTISERQYRTMWTKLANAGITRTREPDGVAIPRETPTLIGELLEYHTQELGYTLDGLSALLGILPADLKQMYDVTGPTLKLVRKPDNLTPRFARR